MREKKQVVAAEYIASMCNELAALAQKNGFDFGAYLLRMACVEFAKQQDQPDKRATGRAQP
jgi:hypothetical protein